LRRSLPLPAPARFKRLAPQVLAVKFEQVEGAEKYLWAPAHLSQPLEHRQAVVVADHRLAINQAGAHLDADPLRRASEAIGGRIAAAMAGKPTGSVFQLKNGRR
jgi:hypothetical protein